MPEPLNFSRMPGLVHASLMAVLSLYAELCSLYSLKKALEASMVISPFTMYIKWLMAEASEATSNRMGVAKREESIGYLLRLRMCLCLN